VPTYQYSCTDCGASLEAQQSFSDEPLTVCPECEGRLRKVFSAVGVVFKGSGFYRTDSRPKPSEAGASASNGSSSDGSSSDKSGSGSGDSATSSGDSGSSASSSTSGSSSSSGSSKTAKAGSAA
jgi:putative FmdB family regulatory protein